MINFDILNSIESTETELLKAMALHTNILENYFADNPHDETEKTRIMLQHEHYEAINDILGDYLNTVHNQLREIKYRLTAMAKAEQQAEKQKVKGASCELALNMLKDKDGNVPECYAKAVKVLENEKMAISNTEPEQSEEVGSEAYEASEIDIKSEL